MCCPFKEVGERDHSRSPLVSGSFDVQTELEDQALNDALAQAVVDLDLDRAGCCAALGLFRDCDRVTLLHGRLSF
jgi:hypothetical protein